MQLKLALPKGRLMAPTAALLERACLQIEDYGNSSRYYRLECRRFPGLEAKVFQEKDIPIQVAVGNYDLGICGLDWIEELLAKFPASPVVKVRDLGYGLSHLNLLASFPGPLSQLETLNSFGGVLRLATEYPNLAEAFALRLRLKRFQVFPLWGAAEAYPPESAELALASDNGATAPGLRSLACVLSSSAYLIANRLSWESRDLAGVVSLVAGAGVVEELAPQKAAAPLPSHASSGSQPALSALSALRTPSLRSERTPRPVVGESLPKGPGLRLALPDGHQLAPTLAFLRQARIDIQGYAENGSRRPTINLPGVAVKVIRPQDMPLQVACGNFDLAITGQDWLLDHLVRFPTSPVAELLNLGFGQVRVVAVVSQELPVATGQQLRGLVQQGPDASGLRVASEYVNIADKYARDHHLGHYQVIPTWGASEAFLPEDADLLIENTQTGRTLAEHKLKIIDTIMESRACLIARQDGSPPGIDALVERFRRALGT